MNILFTAIIMALACSESSRITDNETYAHHTYYVSPEGNDSNPGTIRQPVKSAKAVLNKLLAGDTLVFRKGVYYEPISLSRSGTADSWITLKAYPGEKAVIDGSQTTVSGWQALLAISNVRYISVEGLDICNLSTNSGSVDPEGIAVTGNAHHISIKNCNIYNIKSHSPMSQGRSAHAIFAMGNGTEAITDLTISGCTVHDMQTGTSENITLAGNIDGFTISRNKVYHTENIGIIVAGGDGLNPQGNPATNYARNGVVSDNELYNVSMGNSVDFWGKDNYGAIAIYVCGGAGVIIERNKVYDSDRGIGLVSESNIYPTRNCIVRNNFVYNCWRTGIYMGDYLNYTRGGTKDCQVVNNTLFQNNRTVGAFGEIEGEIRLTENCENNIIRNNIVYARPVDVIIHKYSNSGSGNIIDNNLYFTTGTPQWIWNSTNDAPITDFNTWKTVSGTDAASSFADPQLKSTSLPDLHIQPGSPAVNTGFVISEAVNGKTDIDGRPRIKNNKISKGAQQ
ncbi:right-handed parallel beta-helix repeat-containing protein [Chitinophaga solisilvae]|uniref:right-handed parallel beta-helix repeat-containing protein n=1 Tax=Chitinophaga solisilvae TaxID=1233460 RepID=UPI001F378CE4|nr:right-handed parallel beta-helix repeat-containing protein [Chitinophaga solisilvae]